MLFWRRRIYDSLNAWEHNKWLGKGKSLLHEKKEDKSGADLGDGLQGSEHKEVLKYHTPFLVYKTTLGYKAFHLTGSTLLEKPATAAPCTPCIVCLQYSIGNVVLYRRAERVCIHTYNSAQKLLIMRLYNRFSLLRI